MVQRCMLVVFISSSFNILSEKLQEQESRKVILMASTIKLQFNTSFRQSAVSSGKKLAALNYNRSTIISKYKLTKFKYKF